MENTGSFINRNGSLIFNNLNRIKWKLMYWSLGQIVRNTWNINGFMMRPFLLLVLKIKLVQALISFLKEELYRENTNLQK